MNERIRAKEVRVIDTEGEQLGIMALPAARGAADDRDLDLIEVAPNASPPVCRIMDYGKFRYEQRKKAKEAQKKSKQTEMKMLRVRPNTDDHDLAFKTRNARKFLSKGNKVKFTVIFRGPELRHKDIGDRQLRGFAKNCDDIAVIDQPPRMEGRRMTMILAPLPETLALAAAQRQEAAQESEATKAAKRAKAAAHASEQADDASASEEEA